MRMRTRLRRSKHSPVELSSLLPAGCFCPDCHVLRRRWQQTEAAEAKIIKAEAKIIKAEAAEARK